MDTTPQELGAWDLFMGFAWWLLLSTQMALLRLSADTSYVGTQKDTYGLKVAQTLQTSMTGDAFTIQLAFLFTLLYVDCCM